MKHYLNYICILIITLGSGIGMDALSPGEEIAIAKAAAEALEGVLPVVRAAIAAKEIITRGNLTQKQEKEINQLVKALQEELKVAIAQIILAANLSDDLVGMRGTVRVDDAINSLNMSPSESAELRKDILIRIAERLQTLQDTQIRANRVINSRKEGPIHNLRVSINSFIDKLCKLQSQVKEEKHHKRSAD